MSMLDKIPAPSENDGFCWPDVLRVLVVDQHLFDMKRVDRLIHMLDVQTDICSVNSLEEVDTALAHETYDLIVISHSLPDVTARHTLDVISAPLRNTGVATVLITEPGHHQLGIAALKRGCGDYIASDSLSPEAMEKAVLNALYKAQLCRASNEHVQAG